MKTPGMIHMKLTDILMDSLPDGHPWCGNIKGLADRLIENGVSVQKWNDPKMVANDINVPTNIQQIEEREWELLNLLSSAWHGKQYYFTQEDGTVYSRESCQYLTFDQAIDEFAQSLTVESKNNKFQYGTGFINGFVANQPKWISVKDALPKNEKHVLIATKWSLMGMRGMAVSCGFHTDGKTFTGESDYNWDAGNVDLDYDEEEDEYIVPEGWWEGVRYTEQFSAVDEPVLYWMPLPEPPKED